jgi:hypothetical protein
MAGVWRGDVWWGEAWQGKVIKLPRNGQARRCMARLGLARQGKVLFNKQTIGKVKQMSMNKVDITIKGTSPILMNAYPMMEINPPLDKRPKEEQAEFGAYRVPDGRDNEGELYYPAVNIQRCLVGAASFSKGKGRSSLQKQTAACVIVTPEYVLFGTRNYEIDTRPVVIPTTKGRVLRHRPRLNDWRLSFSIEYDPSLLKEKEMRQIVDDAGSRVGLGDFRPERKGPYGRFVVVAWK